MSAFFPCTFGGLGGRGCLTMLGFGVWVHSFYCDVSEMQQMGESAGRRWAWRPVAGIHHHTERVQPGEASAGDSGPPADLEWKLNLRCGLLLISSYSYPPLPIPLCFSFTFFSLGS